jgi:hypothetical protein
MVADKFLNWSLDAQIPKFCMKIHKMDREFWLKLHGPTCQAEEVSLCSTSPIHALSLHLTET